MYARAFAIAGPTVWNSLPGSLRDVIDVIYTDFEKAFDKVPHKRLLSKLRSYRIDNSIVEWIKSFLTDRKQRVRVNGEFSCWAEVLSGIPQLDQFWGRFSL